MPQRPFRLGRVRSSSSQADSTERRDFDLPPHHLVTHAVCVGMTGSGKTGLCIGLVEEALRSRVPVLMIDVKGDLANLALAFNELEGAAFAPWVDPDAARREGKSAAEVADALAHTWKQGLAAWGLGEADVRALREGTKLRIITPGTSAGEGLHVLSPLEHKSELWEIDEEAAREALSAAISLLLRMVKRDADPTRGREHVLLAHLSERRLRAGESARLEDLLVDLREPPIDRIGALSVDEFLPPRERAELAQDLNALVASPTFATWRQGAPLDVGSWMATGDDGRAPATIVSVAHLEDEERMLVVSLVLEQALAWVRSLPGTTDLRALVLFDELFGFLPPHPANPPTKRPLLALLKQARAFGVGCALATQNPIDLDYKALSNAGVWFVGRLQTDTDRERVVEGLVGSDAGAGDTLDAEELGALIKALPPRTFFVRDVHAKGASELLETRWTLSWLRGPMTRQEIRRWARGTQGLQVSAPSSLPPPLAANGAGGAKSLAALQAEVAPEPEPIDLPELPDGWRPLFPFPPAAPTTEWKYLPHAAIVARAELVDARIGYRESRRIALLAPCIADGIDFGKLGPFEPDDLRHAAVAGADFLPLGDAFKGARATKATERALRDRVLAAARTTIYVNAELDLTSTPGESHEAFEARCTAMAKMRAAQERAAILAKHDPKIQRLATQVERLREAFHSADANAVLPALLPSGARARERADKLRVKLGEAEGALHEAIARRNNSLATREAELAQAAALTTTREIVAKKDALVIDALAIVWLAA
jgi:DNA helicase HerA-like ATPase